MSQTTMTPYSPTPSAERQDPSGRQSDEALMQIVATTNTNDPHLEQSISKLVDRHTQTIFRYFQRRNQNNLEAEDLVQEVFLRVLRNRQKFRQDHSFLPWLFTIARNLLISHCRKKTSEVKALKEFSDLNHANSEAHTNPLTKSENEEEQLGLQRAFSCLTEIEQEVIRLARFEGLDYAQIGLILNCSAGAVKVRAFRALQKLRLDLNPNSTT